MLRWIEQMQLLLSWVVARPIAGAVQLVAPSSIAFVAMFPAAVPSLCGWRHLWYAPSPALRSLAYSHSRSVICQSPTSQATHFCCTRCTNLVPGSGMYDGGALAWLGISIGQTLAFIAGRYLLRRHGAGPRDAAVPKMASY